MGQRPKVRELDSSYLSCRDMGHAWDEIAPEDWGPGIAPAAFGWLRLFKCLRCETFRRDTIDHLGYVGARSYDYPEGYMLAEHTPAKAPFRMEIARRRGIRLSSKKRKPNVRP